MWGAVVPAARHLPADGVSHHAERRRHRRACRIQSRRTHAYAALQPRVAPAHGHVCGSVSRRVHPADGGNPARPRTEPVGHRVGPSLARYRAAASVEPSSRREPGTSHDRPEPLQPGRPRGRLGADRWCPGPASTRRIGSESAITHGASTRAGHRSADTADGCRRPTCLRLGGRCASRSSSTSTSSVAISTCTRTRKGASC